MLLASYAYDLANNRSVDTDPLGQTTTTAATTPVAVLKYDGTTLSGVTAIAVEQNTTSAVSGGTVWSWGDNDSGQLGIGTSHASAHSEATPVTTVSSIGAIATGSTFALVLSTDGNTLYAWGLNTNGQLGNNTTTTRTSPVTVSGLSGKPPLAAVAAGSGHGLAIANDTSLLAWGANTNGQLGDNTQVDKHSPVAVSGLTGVTAIAGGDQHSKAALSTGAVWSWGLNATGQLGDGSLTLRLTPVAVNGLGGSGTLSGIAAVAAGASQSLALSGTGNVFGWGANGHGQAGDSTTTSRHNPVQVVGPGGTGQLTGMTALAAGANHSLAIESVHRVVTTYTYDRMDRLLTGGALGEATSYTDDARGNRLSLTAGTTTTRYAYDRADRITQIGTATPTVNSNGNLMATGIGGTTYSQDVSHRRVTVLSSATHR